MNRLSTDSVRTRLETDRVWAAFSLADLDPPFARHATWYGPHAGSAVVLVYRAYDPPLLVCHGSAESAAQALESCRLAVGPGRPVYMSATADWLPLLDEVVIAPEPRPMVRMLLDLEMHRFTSAPGLVRLGPADLPAVQALYRHDPPAFFLPAQLRDGIYYGVRDAGGLAAIAGTHVLSPGSAVGAIGNVYTRPDRRRQGLAAAVTSAVGAELLRLGIDTVVLNITADNEPARRVYERIGFREYCLFLEGPATFRAEPAR